jgi:2-methylisocitrate lyase-like PEP mutase family enzyme
LSARAEQSQEEQAEKARRFLRLHRGEAPLRLADAPDRGSTKPLASPGLDAPATTSSGFARAHLR